MSMVINPYAFAAVGGGGGAGPTPGDPQLAIWYDNSVAGDFSYSSGSVVATQLDKSGNGRTRIPGPAGAPARVGSHPISGLGIVRYTGASMRYEGSNIITGSQMTVLHVVHYDWNIGHNRSLSMASSTATGDWDNAGSIAISSEGDRYPATYRDNGARAADAHYHYDEWVASIYVFDGTNSVVWTGSDTIDETSPTVASTGNFDIDMIYIGQNCKTGSDVWNGTEGELAIWSVAKTGTALTDLKSYAVDKWFSV